MPTQLAKFLRDTIATELPHLERITDEAASIRPAGPETWSPKQELGHLIDSASNNHIRFVRAALEPELTGPGYAQSDWVELHGYQQKSWLSTVRFWHSYNTFLADLVERIPAAKLLTICKIGSYEPATLRFVIEDYVLHLQHHIDHLLQRAAVTQYPSARAMAK
jgi:hypothetical protein